MFDVSTPFQTPNPWFYAKFVEIEPLVSIMGWQHAMDAVDSSNVVSVEILSTNARRKGCARLMSLAGINVKPVGLKNALMFEWIETVSKFNVTFED